MVEKIKNKRGQVTIFVIIALVIVGAVIFLFLLKRPAKLEVSAEENPQLFLQKCVREETLNAINIMLSQGGFILPENYKLYKNDKVEYLCYNEGYYNPCISQHPMYINELREEMKNYLKPKIEDCFASLRRELQKRNSDVSMGVSDINIELMPSRIEITINRKITITKSGEARSFDKFEIITISNLYDLGNAAIEIANMEGKYCNFEYVGYMLLNPQFDIDKFSMSDGTKMYSIEDKRTGEKLKIAIRGCVAPPGI